MIIEDVKTFHQSNVESQQTDGKTIILMVYLPSIASKSYFYLDPAICSAPLSRSVWL
jgi:hypothetical protein